MLIKNIFLIFLIFLMQACCPSPQVAEKDEETACKKSPYIWEAADLWDKMEKGEKPFIIEVSPVEKFKVGHIPTAKRVWRPDYVNQNDFPYGGMVADSQKNCSIDAQILDITKKTNLFYMIEMAMSMPLVFFGY